MDSWTIIWIALAALFAVTELATMAFFALYFALGAAAAAIVSAFDLGLTWQLIAFIATSAILLAITRPFLKKKLESEDIHTNVSQIIGRTGVVTIDISNDNNTGQIRIGTEYWTARTPQDAPTVTIISGDKVRVLSVSGVTAYVEALES